ncbi:hypothetical protein SAMN06265360_105243 [Haloechinothrix alba]|uniref:Uncharacterized protein n=1 Tax=Haloechinothrix alba TaxID=664784 RepID=A0A238W8V8_9PSEU|nr:hypothetical protein [Haloechinothrix alba]SNR43016.1 hypothetical protein SAMN06265360_105243 [Haloechinothrix alba]
MTATEPTGDLPTHRDRAILAAVRAGRVELTCSSEPDLFIDGLYCSDQRSAHRLVHAGLITSETSGDPGSRVAAVLTARGSAVLAERQDPGSTGDGDAA